MKVVIIIPTYNEKGNIERLITILEEEIFPKIKNHEMNILVADDTSPDGTANIVRELMKKYKNIDLIIGPKQGLGAAYVRAMDYAVNKMNAQVMFEMDADLSHTPGKIPEFLKKIDDGYDFVVGARYIKGGGIPQNWGLHRKAFSVFGNLIVRVVLGRFWHHDFTTGYRAIRREVFEKLRPELTAFRGYTFQVSFLHKAMQQGFKIAEIPFHFVDRTLGKSKIAPREYIFDLLKYIFTARFFEILRSPFPKYAITGFLGYFINAIGLEVFSRLQFTYQLANVLNSLLERSFSFFGVLFLGIPTIAFVNGIAGGIGAELAIIWNFTLNNFWSFRQYKIIALKKILPKFLQFNAIGVGSIIIIFTSQALGTNLFGPGAKQIILIFTVGFLVIPYSYSMYNLFIWKRWRPQFLRKVQDLLG